MTAQANWDGHQCAPAGALSLPERIVHAVEAAVEGAGEIYPSALGDKVDGFSADMARSGAAALLDVLAEAEKQGLVWDWRELAQQVLDVPAVEAV